jgi:hypothetical protein
MERTFEFLGVDGAEATSIAIHPVDHHGTIGSEGKVAFFHQLPPGVEHQLPLLQGDIFQRELESQTGPHQREAGNELVTGTDEGIEASVDPVWVWEIPYMPEIAGGLADGSVRVADATDPRRSWESARGSWKQTALEVREGFKHSLNLHLGSGAAGDPNANRQGDVPQILNAPGQSLILRWGGRPAKQDVENHSPRLEGFLCLLEQTAVKTAGPWPAAIFFRGLARNSQGGEARIRFGRVAVQEAKAEGGVDEEAFQAGE